MKQIAILLVIQCTLTIDPANVSFEWSRPDIGVGSLDVIPLTPKATHLDNSPMQYNPHQRIKSIYELGMTPKATNLSNHFGTALQSNVQGPGGSGVNFAAMPQGYQVGSGAYQNPADFTEVSRNQPLSEPEVDPLRDSPKLRKLVNSDASNCVIELQAQFPSCSSLGSCESCVASRNCGQELKSGRCLPGSPLGSSCPLWGAVWKFGGGCPNGPTSGHMTNVAPENSGLVRPEQRSKLGASGSWWKEIDPAGHVRVVSGDFSNLAAEAKELITPKQRSAPNDTEVPDTWDPNVPDGKHVISGQIQNLAPGAVDLISPKAPNVFNVGLKVPELNQVLTHVFLQEKEKTKLRTVI